MQARDTALEADFAAQGFDLPAHVFDHADQPEGADAVSYTHLDVYKRQDLQVGSKRNLQVVGSAIDCLNSISSRGSLTAFADERFK